MTEEIALVELTEQQTAVVRDRVSHDGIADFLDRAFGTVMAAVTGSGRHVVGPPFARYMAMDESGWDIEAGFPVDGPVEGSGVESGRLPDGSAAQVLHRGSYDSVASTWQRAEAWMVEQGYTPTAAPWESYLDGPEVAEPRTLIVLPCATSGDAG